MQALACKRLGRWMEKSPAGRFLRDHAPELAVGLYAMPGYDARAKDRMLSEARASKIVVKREETRYVQ
tara:strand:+ start:737 stop:940 length:204 start_codon:yes stop_codon:yes gene_type:complete